MTIRVTSVNNIPIYEHISLPKGGFTTLLHASPTEFDKPTWISTQLDTPRDQALRLGAKKIGESNQLVGTHMLSPTKH